MSQINVEKIQSEPMFTQEEVNLLMRKRLTRVKRGYDKDFQFKMLQIEVLGRLKKENIPTCFASMIVVSKNENRTRKTLEQFVQMWHEAKI